jgi:hypothetical protein
VVGSDWLVATKVTVTEPMVAGEVVGVVTWAVRVPQGVGRKRMRIRVREIGGSGSGMKPFRCA